MRHGNETPQPSWNKKQTEKSKQSETCRAKLTIFRLCFSKNNVKRHCSQSLPEEVAPFQRNGSFL